MTQNALSDAQEAQELAEARLATVRADAERKALEGVSGLSEDVRYATGHPMGWYDQAGFTDSQTSIQEWATIVYRASIDTRENERFQPFYLDEDDLLRKRAEWRNISAFSAVAIGANESRKNYVLGPGFEYQVTPDKEEYREIADRVQAVVDQFCEDNEVAGILDAEIFDRTSTDGETFVALYPNDWRSIVRLIEPEQVTEPLDPRPVEEWQGFGEEINYWWHGVHTQARQVAENAWIDDATHPLGYHVVYDSLGEYWDYIPEVRLEHFKRNTPVGARRGVSDFMAVLRDIELEAKLRRNTGEGAAVQAAIAFIRQHAAGTNPSSLEDFAASSRTGSYTQQTDDGASRTVHTRKFNSGTILDIPANLEYHAGPLGSNQSPIYVEVAGYLLRAIGVRWSMPEYIISSDASNANFASTLVSESPFVKAREREQKFYIRHFLRLTWKAVRIAWEAGAFPGIAWQELQAAVSIEIDAPEVATRDRLANAQEKLILSQAGLLSRRTWAGEVGYDYDEERKRLSEEPQAISASPGIGFESMGHRLWEGYP